MTRAQDLGNFLGRLYHEVPTDSLYKNNIHTVIGAAPYQARLCRTKWNNDLVIFAAEGTTAPGFQHTDHTERLPFDTNCFSGNAICMAEKRFCNFRAEQNHRGAPEYMFLGDKIPLSQAQVSHLKIFGGNPEQLRGCLFTAKRNSSTFLQCGRDRFNGGCSKPIA